MPVFQNDSGTAVVDRTRLQPPKKYKVIFYNDDFTPMDFVVSILVNVFHKDMSEAIEIMMLIHETGRGIAGIYSHEVADEKRIYVQEIARNFEFPLRVEIEPDEALT